MINILLGTSLFAGLIGINAGKEIPERNPTSDRYSAQLDQLYRREQESINADRYNCLRYERISNYGYGYYVNDGKVYTVRRQSDAGRPCGLEYVADLDRVIEQRYADTGTLIRTEYKIEKDTVYYNFRPVETQALCKYSVRYSRNPQTDSNGVWRECEKRSWYLRDGGMTQLNPRRFAQ